MEQPAQLRNNFIGVILLLIVGISSCRQTGREAPRIFVNAADHSFTTKQGITYLDGQVFSGYEFACYDNKDTAFLIPFYNGKEQGTSKTWYPHHQIKDTRNYLQGKKTGIHYGWWPDGKPKFVYHFNNDVYEGSLKEWWPSGELFKRFHYRNGQEQGLQQQYFRDGSFQLNYEAKNGRNYGLTGVKNCVNVSDSVGLKN